MTRHKTFYESALFVAVIAIAATIIIGGCAARYEICRAYYSEISLFSCMYSEHGLPPRGTR
jgi:hypothetical protein